MKILYLCQRIPYPPDRGDRIPVFQQIKRLSRTHDVVVGSLAHSGTLENAELLRKDLRIKLHAPSHSRIRQILGMVSAFLVRKPLTLGYFKNPKLRAEMDSCHDNELFDAIIVFSSSMAQYAERRNGIPRIMHFCDLDSQKWDCMAAESHGLMRWIYKRECRLLLEYERKIAAQFNISCVVSHNEAALFQRLIPGIPAHLLENGVDVDFFAGIPRKPEGLRIVFVGVMDYEPNVEAVFFFAKSVWPIVLTNFPEAHFVIVGSQPTKKVRDLAQLPGIEVTGYVPDVRPYLATATLSVVPITIARGVQNKVLEAMAAGLPVLTTPEVAQGLPAGTERFIYIAEREPNHFAEALLKLLKDPSALEKKSRQAQEFVQNNHTWEIKLRALDALLEQLPQMKH
jgi:sugar transferase (PEP-CTERM/EpsH1 system associated)